MVLALIPNPMGFYAKEIENFGQQSAFPAVTVAQYIHTCKLTIQVNWALKFKLK